MCFYQKSAPTVTAEAVLILTEKSSICRRCNLPKNQQINRRGKNITVGYRFIGNKYRYNQKTLKYKDDIKAIIKSIIN